jgi:hypothetical protein
MSVEHKMCNLNITLFDEFERINDIVEWSISLVKEDHLDIFENPDKIQ